MRTARSTLRTAALLACVLGTTQARAIPWDHWVPVCIEDVRQLPEHIGRIPIPLGCEVIDCCIGCPAERQSRSFDWRVQIAGRALGSVAIQFEDPAAVGSLKIEGDGRAAERGAIVGRGGATLHDLRASGNRAPVGFLQLALDPAAVGALQDQRSPASGTGAADVDSIEISIDQLLGPIPVNEFRFHAALRHCRPLPVVACADDTVVQHDNLGGDSSVILIDGNRGGACSNDDIYRADLTAPVGNLLEPASCSTDLAVFSSGDAMELHHPENGWTNACGDQVDVQLKPILTVPVYIWLADAAYGKEADHAIAIANAIYDENKTGIRFAIAQKKVIGSVLDRIAVNTGCTGAGSLSAKVPNQLNAYFIDIPSTGESCAPGNEAVFIGTAANGATLAHEFGHVLSLFGNESTGGHVNTLAGFSDDNVMWGGGPATRKYFTLGQAFRFNVDDRSLLNLPGGVRSGPEWRCEALASSPACPELRLNWARP